MSEFKNVRVCKWKRCKNMNDLRDFLGSKVPPVDIGGEKPDFTEVDIGYIEPGHGLKGRKQWINIDDDVDVMYSKYAGKTAIMLWAYSCVLTSSKNSGKKTGNFEKHQAVLSEVEEKYDELREKHGNKYTLEQLRMWAQIIRLGKHESTDDPPDKPFWRGRKRQQDVSCLSLSPKRASFRPDVSPSKDQLTKWHNLSECGVVSHEEYEEFRKIILGDIKH